jgi:hypothetical protein
MSFIIQNVIEFGLQATLPQYGTQIFILSLIMAAA